MGYKQPDALHSQRAPLWFHLSTEHYPRKTVSGLWRFLQTLVLASLSLVESPWPLSMSPTWCSVWFMVQAETTTPDWSRSAWISSDVGFVVFFSKICMNLQRLPSLTFFLTLCTGGINSFITVKLLDKIMISLWSSVIALYPLELLYFSENSISNTLRQLFCLHHF